jgi:hypothetical protein
MNTPCKKTRIVIVVDVKEIFGVFNTCTLTHLLLRSENVSIHGKLICYIY